jgi:hypothetical protein
MEVGVSMVDWLTYKGQNPWTCVALHDKVEYNEGSYVAKSPEVFGGTPIWKVGKTGPAITDTHIPCGYWFKDYREYIPAPAPAPPVTEYYFIHNFETAVDQPDYVWDMENPESFELYHFNYNHSRLCVLDPDAKFGNYACHVVSNTIFGMYYEPLYELTPPLTYEFWFKLIEGSKGSYMEIWLNGYRDLGYDWLEAMYQVIFGIWKGVNTSFANIGTWGGGYDYEEYTEYPVFYRPFSFNVYNHYAIVILPDRIKTFINGILFKEYISGGFNVPYCEFFIDNEDGSKLLIDALSITKGAKYTENFTPPTKPPSK